MRKINYPTKQKELDSFQDSFINSLNKVNEVKINIELRKAPPFKGKILTFDSLVTLPFDDLFLLIGHLKTFIDSYNIQSGINKKGKKKTIVTNTFNDLFNYKLNQPSISFFYMQAKSLKIKTCYYCGIDYVNSFKDIGDYKNEIDFLNRAEIEELKIVKGIGQAKSNFIVKYRKKNKIKKSNEITKSLLIINELKKINFKNTHNHFTLDHVLPQSKYKFLSLCLYNLVPSCYSCNSKFKKDNDFILNKDILKISPTSSSYNLNNDFEFRIFYSNKLQNIKCTTDFVLYRKILRNKIQINKYISLFKIDGRYTVHKNKLLTLIDNKAKYSKKIIKKIAFDMGESEGVVRKMIFGDEIFSKELDVPFHKLKRDVAKNIKIL
jgi:hypothetical protein